MRRLAILLTLGVLASPVAAQDLLDRVQGLYVPDGMEAFWDCQSVGQDGGAVAIRGSQILGVENACALKDPVPVPGMDAVRYNRTCSGEGTTYDAGPVILTPTDRGVGLMFDGFVTEWIRCR